MWAKTQKRFSGINVRQTAMLEKLICPHTEYEIAGFSGGHVRKKPKILEDFEVDVSQQKLRETATSKLRLH